MPETLPGQLPLPTMEAWEAEAVESFQGIESENDSLRPGVTGDTDPSVGTRLVGLGLENFKGFKAVDVDLTDFNILVGTNNSGKSTILQAIKLGHFLLRQHYPEVGNPAKGRTLPAAILPVAEPRDLWYRGQWRLGNQPVRCKISLRFTGDLVFTFGLRLLYGAVNSQILEAPGLITHEELDRVRAFVPVLVPSSVGLVTHEERRHPARVTTLVQTGRQNEAVRNMLQDLQDHQPLRFEELRGLIGQHFDVDLQAVRFDPSADQYIDARYDQAGADLDLFSAGAGLIQVVQLLAFSLRGSHGVVLLDEPDAHLHSSMQLIVVDMLGQLSRQYGFQVIISTHSKEIINFVSPSLLIPVSKEEKLGPLEAHATAMAVLQDLGPIDNVDLYSLFTSKRCCFVEGKSDIAFLMRVASRLKSTIFEGDSRVILISTGGVDNFAPAVAVKVFGQMAGVDIAHFTIRDRDGLPDPMRMTLMERAEGRLHVYERDSIESYLVDASSFRQVVADNWIKTGKGEAPEVDEFKALVEEAAESLKDETADRIANALDRWYAREESRHLSAGELGQMSRSIRDEVWDDPLLRLKYVPGKRLLAACRQLIKNRYDVTLVDQGVVDGLGLERGGGELPQLVEQCEAL